MSSVTVNLDELDDYIEKVLDEYGDKARLAIRNSAIGVSKAAANKVKSKAPERSGKYRSGWKTTNEEDRLSFEAIVYESTRPGLTHLLEKGHAINYYGHVLRAGGRTSTKAISHIAPAEEWAIEEFMTRVEKELKR